MVLLILTSMALFTGASGQFMCTDLNSLTNPHIDQRLVANTFLSMETNGLMICASECLKRQRCKSINFQTTVGTCELNLNTSSEVGTLTSTDDWFYYDVALVNTAVAGVCDSHVCSYNELCQPNSSQPVCPQCSNATDCGVCSNVWETSSRQFRSYGCFQGRALPHLIVNLRSAIVWSNMAKTIMDCAAAANTAGYELFGIEFHGECYGGSYAEAVFSAPVPIADCANACWAGVGGASKMVVYTWLDN